jgi:hypothetical protein
VGIFSNCKSRSVIAASGGTILVSAAVEEVIIEKKYCCGCSHERWKTVSGGKHRQQCRNNDDLQQAVAIKTKHQFKEQLQKK